MDVEITPAPEGDEREALIAGLERLLADSTRRLPPQYRSAWRLAGLREATEAALPPPAVGGRGDEQP